MKKKKVTKLWQGLFTSVRDYELDDAIKKGGLQIQHNNKTMTISKKDCENILKNPHTKKSKLMKSKVGGRNYHLIDITFKEDEVDSRQQVLFD